MKRSRYLPYAVLLACHVLLALIAFKDFRLHMNNTIFCNDGDGLKNYFTLLTYVKEPFAQEGIFRYKAMNYPFGEYIFTTDNTPLFSIPFRAFCQHVWDVSAYTLTCYNLFIIGNILLCGLLLLFALRYTVGNNTLAFLFALILPWINVQVLRIPRGHFNLSLSSLVVGCICLLILWHKHRHSIKRQAWIGTGAALLVFAGFLAHGYYLPMLGAFFFFAFGSYTVYYFRKDNLWKRSLAAALLVPLLGLGLSLGLLQIGDGFLAQRSGTANGFDQHGAKLDGLSLFSAYTFETVAFPLHRKDLNNEPEIAAYLGSAGLYALAVIALVAVFRPRFRRQVWSLQREYFRDPLLGALFIGGGFLLSMAMGVHYEPQDNSYAVDNLFNPLFYLSKWTEKVTEFRSAGRFAFPFYFTFYIWLLWLLARFYGQSKAIRGSMLAGIIILGGTGISDYVNMLQRDANRPSSLGPAAMAQADSVRVRFTDYAAIVPIPFFAVGSEDYERATTDDYSPMCDYMFKLSLRSGLPLVASKLARTVDSQAASLFNWLANDVRDSALRARLRLNNKPLLLVVHKKWVTDSTLYCVPHTALMREDYWKINSFTTRHHLQPFDSSGDFLFYRYDVR